MSLVVFELTLVNSSRVVLDDALTAGPALLVQLAPIPVFCGNHSLTYFVEEIR